MRGHNPLITVIPVGTTADLAALDSDLLGRARLIAFVTPEIVSKDILARLGYGAFNFHPGPPSYPGWAPAHFALYERATEFGATVHVMVEQVDAGPIVDVAMFPIPAGISVAVWRGWPMPISRNYSGAWQSRWRPIRKRRPRVRSNGAAGNIPAAPIEQICDIPLDIPKDELERRLSVFGGNHFGMCPTVNLHGIEFRAVLPQS